MTNSINPQLQQAISALSNVGSGYVRLDDQGNVSSVSWFRRVIERIFCCCRGVFSYAKEGVSDKLNTLFEHNFVPLKEALKNDNASQLRSQLLKVKGALEGLQTRFARGREIGTIVDNERGERVTVTVDMSQCLSGAISTIEDLLTPPLQLSGEDELIEFELDFDDVGDEDPQSVQSAPSFKGLPPDLSAVFARTVSPAKSSRSSSASSNEPPSPRSSNDGSELLTDEFVSMLPTFASGKSPLSDGDLVPTGPLPPSRRRISPSITPPPASPTAKVAMMTSERIKAVHQVETVVVARPRGIEAGPQDGVVQAISSATTTKTRKTEKQIDQVRYQQLHTVRPEVAETYRTQPNVAITEDRTNPFAPKRYTRLAKRDVSVETTETQVNIGARLRQRRVEILGSEQE